ncbi:transglutaminase domain-containing protein [Breznakia pachnodae]|uniref:Transglutaminase-like domain-containing protein n=1 Tax=Breznakia pachnodae TaxID=265178 RepID=A0ABU0E2D4_9FIRM|nr:transglutaminase domain-containing protein [Breznakia pachnodae]MDQ0360863.1 hypothetical protein [Breznakia pachnodae]
MNKKSKSVVALLALAVVLSGCGGSGSDKAQITNEEFTTELKGKYEGEETYSYEESLSGLERDHSFEFKFGFDPNENYQSLGQLFQVYMDADLKYPVSISYDYDKEKQELIIQPPKTGVLQLPDEKRGGKLYDLGNNKDWGNAQQYYLVQYVDLDTGEELEKPLVTVFDTKHEVSAAPNLKFQVNEDGLGELSWDEIEGASEYSVVKVQYYKKEAGYSTSGESIEVLATTEDSSWSNKGGNSNSLDNDNKAFRISVEKTEDTLYSEYKNDDNMSVEDFTNNANIIEGSSTFEYDIYYAVIATNDDGTSSVSNLVDARYVAQQTPYELAYYLNKGGLDKEKYLHVEEDPNLLPSHAWVTMCDGQAVQKLINYDISDIKLDSSTFIVTDEDEKGTEVTKNEELDYISIPFKIEGTSVEGFVEVVNYDEKTYEQDLKDLKARQDDLRDQAGSIDKDVDLNEEVEDDGDAATEVSTEGFNVYANSALSEYLAINMLNGNTKISLDDFNEASSQEYLLDAWYEAIYQNPLVLGVQSIRMDGNNNVIITYDEDADTKADKQAEIQTKVKEVVAEIITDDMTDIEKEEAINDYLCANAEYDMDALDNAEKNDFKTVDEEFNDSFTAYGILINNKGVCAGYAAAFKLLADEAGLESIVVTGNLDGSLPHAWNRVKIDGQWLSIDTTNNDNEFISNSLFNLPDSISSKVLVEDKLYVMDSVLNEFTASEENNEYYRYHSKYFDTSSITDELLSGINADGKVVLRTEYSISEEDFAEIAGNVQEKSGKSLRGTYYLGVIYLEVAN